MKIARRLHRLWRVCRCGSLWRERANEAFILALEFATVLPPRPAFVGGKGGPCEKEKGGPCEERELKPRLIQKNFSPRWAREKQYPNTGRIKLFSHRERLRTQFFTSSKARSSSRSFPSKARKRWLQSWDPATFSVKDV